MCSPPKFHIPTHVPSGASRGDPNPALALNRPVQTQHPPFSPFLPPSDQPTALRCVRHQERPRFSCLMSIESSSSLIPTDFQVRISHSSPGVWIRVCQCGYAQPQLPTTPRRNQWRTAWQTAWSLSSAQRQEISRLRWALMATRVLKRRVWCTIIDEAGSPWVPNTTLEDTRRPTRARRAETPER